MTSDESRQVAGGGRDEDRSEEEARGAGGLKCLGGFSGAQGSALDLGIIAL